MSDRMTHSVAKAWVQHQISTMMKKHLKDVFSDNGSATKLSPADFDMCFEIYISIVEQFERNRLSLEERLKYEIE